MSIGIDYAHVDDNAPPNFLAARGAGARFVITRAIYGRPFSSSTKRPEVDSTWTRDKDAIAAAGIVRGAYLFVCYPRNGTYTPEPEEQAQAFIDYVELIAGKDFVPMFDVEERTSLTAEDTFQWTLRVAQTLHAHYGVWPMMYTSALDWHEMLHDHAAGDLINCPLWIAKPWPMEVREPAHLDGALAYSPHTIAQFGDSTNWALYQYQGDALNFPGFDKTVDISRFNTLAKGTTGDAVKKLQQQLGITVDGSFGPMTESALMAFQVKYQLGADGVVGPKTFAALSWQNR